MKKEYNENLIIKKIHKIEEKFKTRKITLENEFSKEFNLIIDKGTTIIDEKCNEINIDFLERNIKLNVWYASETLSCDLIQIRK